MKVIVHHLPTGCRWDVEVREDDKRGLCFNVFNNENLVLDGTDGTTYFFPEAIRNQSVIKVIE